MKALKLTTPDGKTIIAGHEDARFISAVYRIYPDTGKMQYHIYAMLGQKYIGNVLLKACSGRISAPKALEVQSDGVVLR